MKQFLKILSIIICLGTAQYGIASGWDNLSKQQLKNIQLSLNTITDETTFKNKLLRLYAMYGDPSDSNNGIFFLKNMNLTWQTNIQSPYKTRYHIALPKNAPTYNTLVGGRGVLPTPAPMPAPTPMPAPVTVGPAPALSRPIPGAPAGVHPVLDGTNWVIKNSSGTIIATWDGAYWISSLTGTPTSTGVVNPTPTFDGTNWIITDASGTLLATWNGTNWFSTSGTGTGGTTPVPTPVPTLGGATPPPPPTPPTWINGKWLPVGGGTGTGTGTGPVAPVVTFRSISADINGTDLVVKPDPKPNFWNNLSKLNSSAFCKFSVQKETLLTKLQAINPKTPEIEALIIKVTALPAKEWIREATATERANHQPIINELITTNVITYWELATGAVPTLVMALYETSKTAGDFDTNSKIQELVDDLAEFTEKAPADYVIKKISTYFDCIDRIPSGNFQDAFRETLKQTLALATSMNYVAKNPITTTAINPSTLAANNAIALVKTAQKTALTEITAGTLTDTDAVAKLQPLYDAAVTAIKTLKQAIDTAFNSVIKTITSMIDDLGAIPPEYNPAGKLQKGVVALSTELQAFIGTALVPGPVPTPVPGPGTTPIPTPVPTTPIVTTVLGAPGSQFPLEAPIDYTGTNPFARISQAVTVIKENNSQSDSGLSNGVRIGILKTNYDQPVQGTTPLVNAVGGYDLYVWGPNVNNYQTDICIDKLTLKTSTRGADTYQIALRFQNFNSATPIKMTKLYKMASYNKQAIIDLNPTIVGAVDLAAANTGTNLLLKIKYIYQRVLKPNDYNL